MDPDWLRLNLDCLFDLLLCELLQKYIKTDTNPTTCLVEYEKEVENKNYKYM